MGGPPDLGDVANLILPNAYTVQLTGGTAHEADGVVIRNGAVTLESTSTSLPGVLNVTGGSADFDVLGGSVIIGSEGRPVTLTVGDNFGPANIASTTVTANSDVTAADLPLGLSGSSDAMLRVTGAGSTVTITDNVASIAGFGGKAALVVENGATATFSGPVITEITVSVNDDDTRGTVEVLTGGHLNTQSIFVGTRGGGKLAKLLVKDSNSTVTQTGDSGLRVGSSTNNGIIADVTVADSAVFNSGTGAILFQNTGTLHVVGGGAFNANGSLTIKGGAVTIDGGTLNANGPLSIDGGTASLVAGVLDAGAIGLVNGGAFNFTGGTLSVDNFNGSLTQAGGTLAPGASPGLTTITGNYTQNGGSLAIEIGGTDPGVTFDRVAISGAANLMGTLDVTLTGGFTPALGNSFGFLVASGGFSPAFAAINLPDISALGLDWQLATGGSTLLLKVIVGGDFDADNDVDGNDLAQWKGDFGANADSDADNDGDSDGADFLIWQRQLGNGPSAQGASATVPEPATSMFVIAAAVGIRSIRGRWRRELANA